MLSFRRTLSVEEERWQTFPGPETGLVAAPAALGCPSASYSCQRSCSANQIRDKTHSTWVTVQQGGKWRS